MWTVHAKEKDDQYIPLWGYLEKAWNETVTASGK